VCKALLGARKALKVCARLSGYSQSFSRYAQDCCRYAHGGCFKISLRYAHNAVHLGMLTVIVLKYSFVNPSTAACGSLTLCQTDISTTLFFALTALLNNSSNPGQHQANVLNIWSSHSNQRLLLQVNQSLQVPVFLRLLLQVIQPRITLMHLNSLLCVCQAPRFFLLPMTNVCYHAPTPSSTGAAATRADSTSYGDGGASWATLADCDGLLDGTWVGSGVTCLCLCWEHAQISLAAGTEAQAGFFAL